MTATNAPERIWACRDQSSNYWADGDTPYVTSELVGQYVRADLYAALEAQMATLTAEREAARAVRIKPLEWRDSYSVIRADTPFGSYTTSASGKILTMGVYPGSPQMVCASMYDAKAAAQADYEARILAALEKPE